MFAIHKRIHVKHVKFTRMKHRPEPISQSFSAQARTSKYKQSQEDTVATVARSLLPSELSTRLNSVPTLQVANTARYTGCPAVKATRGDVFFDRVERARARAAT